MKCCKTVYSKGKKSWKKEKYEDKRREYLSETDKGSDSNQGKWVKVYKNHESIYSRALYATYSLTSDNTSNTFSDERLSQGQIFPKIENLSIKL